MSQEAMMNCSEKLTTTTHDPVCGMAVDPARAAGESEYQGETYFFCSTGCKEKFDRSPGQYVPVSAVPATQNKSLEVDPVCGMQVDHSNAAASFEFEGKSFNFCSPGCATKFRAAPEKYL